MTKAYVITKTSRYTQGDTRVHTSTFAVYSSYNRAFGAIQKLEAAYALEDNWSGLQKIVSLSFGVRHVSTNRDGDVEVAYQIETHTLNEDFL